jgi:glycosyltransferase involved in cell wall biosynthesis
VRILIWHGWLLEGSGSNVATARTAEAWRAAGHDVVLLCQERHPERYPWIDAAGVVDGAGPSGLTERPGRDPASAGRCVLLRPAIGETLPVFVVDRYEGFEDVRPFTDLSDDELEAYLRANVAALRSTDAWHRSEFVLTGHAIPGAAVGRRALGNGRYVSKIHGSDLEYAVREQERLRDLAAEGLGGARAVLGPTVDVLERCAELVPEMRGTRRLVVAPGVDVEAFSLRPRAASLPDVAARLDVDPDTARGRPEHTDELVAQALDARDASALDALATTYDQAVPEPAAAARLRTLATTDAPIVGYLGKLIPQKGVELVLGARQLLTRDTEALVVGFGGHREWLAALALALRRGDRDALRWLRETASMPIDATTPPDGQRPAIFTGRLDHRYAPDALAAMTVTVVPSILREAFGMVAAEAAAAGALPVVARHSGLAEVAEALESEVGRPGLFSFAPGEGAVGRLAASIERILSLPAPERDELRAGVHAFVAREWTWGQTASKILAAW